MRNPPKRNKDLKVKIRKHLVLPNSTPTKFVFKMINCTIGILDTNREYIALKNACVFLSIMCVTEFITLTNCNSKAKILSFSTNQVTVKKLNKRHCLSLISYVLLNHGYLKYLDMNEKI